MTHIKFFSLVIIAQFAACYSFAVNNPSSTLWYTQPAKERSAETLPIGNRRMCAMLFGGVEKEVVQLNYQSLWSGDKNWDNEYETCDHGFGFTGLNELNVILMGMEWTGGCPRADKDELVVFDHIYASILHRDPTWLTLQVTTDTKYGARASIRNENDNYKSSKELVHLLVNIIAKGDKLLLGVGQNGKGDFEPKVYENLELPGKWLQAKGEATYETSPVEPCLDAKVANTVKGNNTFYAVYLPANDEVEKPSWIIIKTKLIGKLWFISLESKQKIWF